MGNKYDGMSKGFQRYSPQTTSARYDDLIIFGFYAQNRGGTTGDVSVKWQNIGGRKIIELTLHSANWSALSQYQELFDLLGQHDNEDVTPEQFCQFLLKCGFVDRTT